MSHLLSTRNSTVDTAGAAASLLCAVHCALMPVLVLSIPWLATSGIASETTEWFLVATTVAFAALSLTRGWRIHRSIAALCVLVTGMSLLVGGRICEHSNFGTAGMPLLVTGGLLLMTAHLLNRHLCHSCPCCCEE